MAKAYFRIVLHSHIPYCRKAGVWPAGEEWLFEALLECYIPLFSLFEDRFKNGRPSPVTIGITPILGDQLDDDYMRDRFDQYLERLITAAEKDITRFSDPRSQIARHWRQKFSEVRERWLAWDRDLMAKAHELHRSGAIELITSTATHGLLPRLGTPEAIKAQIKVGMEYYARGAGRPAQGFWLPECGYRPGLEGDLAAAGVKFTFLESHAVEKAALLEGDTRPLSTGEPYHLGSNVMVFARDFGLGARVWSRDLGYPGQPHYLEFHVRDDQNGLRYYRITLSEPKQFYEPERAQGYVGEQADHFRNMIRERIEVIKSCLVPTPVIVVPFDTELYGHWWHEGVDWLGALFDRLDRDPDIASAPLGKVLDLVPSIRTIRAPESSWGVSGDFRVWEATQHKWIWPYIHEAERRMTSFVDEAKALAPRAKRMLTLAGRELLLMEASDWPFLLYTQQTGDYGNHRFHRHHQRFSHLMTALASTDPKILRDKELDLWEDEDDPFPWLDPFTWKS